MMIEVEVNMGSETVVSGLGSWYQTMPLLNDAADLSFEELYKQYAPAVYRFALSIVGDPQVAEEITSESFYRAWTHQDTIKQSTIRSYLFTIAKNVYRDQLRKAKRHEALEGEYVDRSVGFAADLERSEEYRLLSELMGELEAGDREILMFRYQQDLSHEEIGSILGINPANVRIRAFRARKKLLKAYADRMSNT
jgi:RNA polymerase sigma-70 factor (ECF subfamily)